jgi:hypothetical protein
MGWTNIFLGGLTLLLGLDIPGNPPLKTIQAFLGLATILLSIWSIVSPLPIGVAIWAIGLGIAGLWNIFIAIADQGPIAGVFGVLQLWWAYRLYRTHKMNTNVTRPDAESLRTYDTLQRGIQMFNVPNDPDFIRLKIRRRWWKGFLLKERIALVPQQGIALWIAESSKTTFTFKNGWAIFGPSITGTLEIEGISSNKVTFPRTTVERYLRWKGPSDAQPVDWLNMLDANARKRLPIRIALLFILAAPIVFLVLLAVFAIGIAASFGK